MSTLANSPVDDVIALIKRKHFAVTDTELATALGVDKSTISSWRRRGAVPARYTQEKPPSSNISRIEYLICHVFLEIYEAVRREHPFSDDPANKRGWAFAMVSFQKRMEQYLHGIPEQDKELRLEAVRAAALAGDTRDFIDKISFVELP